MAELSKFQKFTIVRMSRRELKGAKYNPRVISADAKKRLKKNLEEVGLLQPVVWNKTTGNVVGGHQKLAILDALEGSDDYLLDVAVVKLSAKREIEQNVFMNNPAAQGDWDLRALADLLTDKDIKISPDNTGFNPLELEIMYSDTDMASLFSLQQQPKEVQEAMTELQEISDARDPVEPKAGADAPAGKTAAASLVAEMRSKKRDIEGGEVNDMDRYVIVHCKDTEQAQDLKVRLGASADDKYISADLVFALLPDAS